MSNNTPSPSGLSDFIHALPRALAAFRDRIEAFNQEQKRKARVRTMYIEFDPATQPPALPGGDGGGENGD